VKFSGAVRIPEIDHPGVPATFVIDDHQAEVVMDDESLGRWSLYDVRARRLISSAFQVELGDDEITFIADDPIDFAYRGVEYMAESWAGFKSMNAARRTIAVKRSRRGTTESKVSELKQAMLDNLEIEQKTGFLTEYRSRSKEITAESVAEELGFIPKAGESDETGKPLAGSSAFEIPLVGETTGDVAPDPATVQADAARLDAQRIEDERLQTERDAIEAERARLLHEKERLEEVARVAEQREADRVEAYRLEMERLRVERENQQRLEAAQRVAVDEEMARLAAEREEAARLLAQREELEAKRAALAKTEHERNQKDAEEAARLESARLEIEKREAEAAAKAEQARIESERLEAERAEQERLAAERAEAAAAEATRLENERIVAEQAIAEAEKAVKAQVEAEKAAAAAVAALEAEQLARHEAELAEKAAAEKAAKAEAAEAKKQARRAQKPEAPVEADDQTPEIVKELLSTSAEIEDDPETSKQLVVDLGEFEDVKEPGDGPQAEPALAGAPKRAGIMGAVKGAFTRGGKNHEHQFVEAPGGIGIARSICEDCGHVSIGVTD
jgi:hypothetical protein